MWIACAFLGALAACLALFGALTDAWFGPQMLWAAVIPGAAALGILAWKLFLAAVRSAARAARDGFDQR